MPVFTIFLIKIGANMKIIKLNIFFGLLFVSSFQASTVIACHKGGAMGTASKDPLNSTIDVSYGYTFLFASTSGTLGCEAWDFVKNNRVQSGMGLTTLFIDSRPQYASPHPSELLHLNQSFIMRTSSVTWLPLMPVRSDIEMAQKWHNLVIFKM